MYPSNAFKIALILAAAGKTISPKHFINSQIVKFMFFSKFKSDRRQRHPLL